MGWFSSVTSVVKKAALAPLTVAKLQARVAGKLLTAASKVAPSATVFGSGARRAAPAPAPAPVQWEDPNGSGDFARAGRSFIARRAAPAPAPSSWFGTAAAALNPSVAVIPTAAAAAPYSAPAYPAPSSPYPPPAPAPYAPPATYYAPPSSSGGGGEVYTGNAYDPDAPADDGYGMSPEDSRQDDASLYDGGELGDATAIDYERHFSGAAGLAGWSDNLLSLAKGAASGALTTGAGILSQPTAAQLKAAADARAKAAAASSSGISPATIAIAGGVGLVGLVLLTRKRGAATVASNPRRRRRSRR